MLASEIREYDRYLVPELLKLAPRQWVVASSPPDYGHAAEVMRRLADPRFVPLLRSWSQSTHDPMILRALAACGAPDSALALARAAVSGMHGSMTRRDPDLRDLILLIGALGGPEDGEFLLRFADHPVLDDAPLLAIARTGHPVAAEMLKDAYASSDIRRQLRAAFALFALGDNTGIELIDLYCERRELEHPEIARRWRADLAGDIDSCIPYLNSPKLDDLYFERTRHAFDSIDIRVAMDSDFIARNRDRLIDMLMTHIDDDSRQVRVDVTQCLSMITGEYLVMLRVSGRDSLQAQVEWWKEYIAAMKSN
jgi:hypothetical protein